MLRVDDEVDTEIDEKSSEILVEKVEKIIANKNWLDNFEDYDKGVLNPKFISKLLKLLRKTLFSQLLTLKNEISIHIMELICLSQI